MANYELVRKALAAKSPEELLKVAKDNKIGDINERNVKAYFDALSTWGELNDDELEMAVGAASFNSDGNRIVALGNLCSNREPYGGPWRCNKCGMPAYACNCYPDPNGFEDIWGFVIRKTKNSCQTCQSIKDVMGTFTGYICTNPEMKR